MKDKKRILLFTGDGKGKTTAALGMALRASGHGMKTLDNSIRKVGSHNGRAGRMQAFPRLRDRTDRAGDLSRSGHDPAFQEHMRAAAEGLKLAATSPFVRRIRTRYTR